MKEIFNGSSDKNPVELGYMFYQLVGKLQYDAATTDGFYNKLAVFNFLKHSENLKG